MKGEKPTCALLVAILVMLILSMALVSVGAASPLTRLSVDPPTYTATLLGEVFTIDINVVNVTSLCILGFKLGYNTTLLDAVDAVEGPFPPEPVLTNIEIHDPEGYVNVSIQCWPATGNGTLATITFNATYEGSASCTLDLYDTVLLNVNGNPITHDVEDGNYKFSILGLTVATDKPSYLLGENVEIHGNLTLDGSPHQGLVALDVDDSANHPIIVRTLQIGTTPPPGNITIVDVFPSDSWGNPKESFERGTLAYFKTTVSNNGIVPKNVTIFNNIYDNNIVPLDLGIALISPLGPGATCSIIRSLEIPQWASIGNATVYANAFTDWIGPGPGEDRPRNGTPYCPEKSAPFQITGSGQGASTLEAPITTSLTETAGNYSLTFKLPRYDTEVGNYTVYASSSYLRRQVVNSTTFKAERFCDVNGDGVVNVIDVVLVCINLGPVPPSPPECDVDDNGWVNVMDVVLVCINIG